MKLITILTLGLCGRTKPEIIPVVPTVCKPLIGDIWQKIDDGEWITPQPKDINKLEIVNVSSDGTKILYKWRVVKGQSTIHPYTNDMAMFHLYDAFKMVHSPRRALRKIENDFRNGKNYSSASPMPQCKPVLPPNKL
jgi:hypothetical protein